MRNTFEVTFLGTNGSCAYNCGERKKYGTNTLCVAVKAGDEEIIFDAGTGICRLSELQNYSNKHKHLYLTHYHMDHIDGLLFYSGLFDPKMNIDVYGRGDVQKVLSDLISPPLCPVGTEVFTAALTYNTVEDDQCFVFPGDLIIKTRNLSHPGGALGCRVEYGSKSFCYCVDIELANHKDDSSLKEFTSTLKVPLRTIYISSPSSFWKNTV